MGSAGSGSGTAIANVLAGGELALRLGYRLAADAHRALLDQRLHAAARKLAAERGGQPLVEPLPGRLGIDRQHYQSAFRFAIRGAHRLEPEFLH